MSQTKTRTEKIEEFLDQETQGLWRESPTKEMKKKIMRELCLNGESSGKVFTGIIQLTSLSFAEGRNPAFVFGATETKTGRYCYDSAIYDAEPTVVVLDLPRILPGGLDLEQMEKVVKGNFVTQWTREMDFSWLEASKLMQELVDAFEQVRMYSDAVSHLARIDADYAEIVFHDLRMDTEKYPKFILGNDPAAMPNYGFEPYQTYGAPSFEESQEKDTYN